MSACLAEDELLELACGHDLGERPHAEAHLADCSTCSTLLAALLEDSPGDTSTPARWGALAGRTLGPYRVEAQIGQGGMGAVYRAWDVRLGRNVAIKVLPAHAADSPALARRLATEARAAAAIAHPNVVTIYDVGQSDGLAYVVAELVEGETLRSLLERRRLPRAEALELADQLLAGLGAAHAQGVIHRDLKPENLVVTSEGTLKILDFGLAKLDEPDPQRDATAPGTIHGTAGYMAPEQACGEPADARSDLFAVGAILYEMLTGERAFDGASHAERLSAVLRDQPPLDPARLGPLGPVLARCLDKDPRRRFQSAQDLAWAIATQAASHAPGTPARVMAASPVAPVAPVIPETPAPPPAPSGMLSRRSLLLAMATGAAGYALGLWRRPPRMQPAFRQLTFRHGRLMSARFTHDGSELLYGAAWDGDALAVHAVRLDGGLTRVLDLPAADVLAVSTQGDLALCLGRRHVDGQSATGQLALARSEGGAARRLLDDVQEADFTPDGRELAIVRPGGRGFHLELPAGRIAYETAGWITAPRLSPDGQRIACLVHPSANDDRGDVVVIDRASGAARTATAGWDSIAGLAWDPDGERLWFSAAREGANTAVYTVAQSGRQPPVSMAHTTGRLRILDVARDPSKGPQVAVSLDAWRLRTIVGRPGGAEIDCSRSDFSLAADLAPDGRTLLVAEFGGVEAANGAYLQPLGEDGSTRGAALRVGAGLPLALSPDGRRVAVKLPGQAPLIVYHTTSAEQPAALLGPITRVIAARWIDNDNLAVFAAAGHRPPRMWRVPVGASAAAAPTPLTEEGQAGPGELDAARRRLAFIDARGRLAVVDLAARTTRILPGTYRHQQVCGWFQDQGQSAIIVRSTTTPLHLVRIDPDSGTATPYRDIAPPPIGLRAVDALLLRGDGGLHVYSYGQELSQLYLMAFHPA